MFSYFISNRCTCKRNHSSFYFEEKMNIIEQYSLIFVLETLNLNQTLSKNCLFFQKNMFPLFLRLPDRKVFDPNGPYICTNQTKIRNVCLSVILSVVVVVWSAPTAYTNLCRGLEYLPKIQYIILVKPNVTGFWFLRLFSCADRKDCPITVKKMTKMNGICVW